MFDIGWTEITFILIFTIIVIGPKELPKVLRTVGQWIGKAKSITSEFRGHVDEMIRDTELDEVKKKIDTAGSFDPNSVLENTIDADGEIKSAFDFSGEEYSESGDLDVSSFNGDMTNNVSHDVELSKTSVLDSTSDSQKNLPTKESTDNGKEIKD